MNELLAISSLLAFVAVTALEIVLGVDNLVFIAIICDRLPAEKQALGRRLGLALAALGRIVLLLAAAWIIMLDEHPLFTFRHWEITAHDLVLLAGGLFLIGKATWEIHTSLEGLHSHDAAGGKKLGMGNAIMQIFMLDLVFSIDSVLTAIGMVEPKKFESPAIPYTGVPWPAFVLMATAIMLAVAVMLFFISPVSNFIKRHPTVKMLALSFLLLIGVVLVAEGLHQHIPRGYIYAAMGFSMFVEMLNLQIRKSKKQPTPAIM